MKVEALRHRFPGPDAFELGPIDVDGPDDRPWLVLGPSGSGKSTLLRLLGDALRPTSGRVSGGRRGAPAAYLPQLPERALAGRNLAEDLCGDARPVLARRTRLRSALHRVGLDHVGLGRPSRTLSAGERRRAAFALLLLAGHERWALDEPDAALDAEGVARVLAILQERTAGGSAGLWIATHRFELYAPLDPWTLVLDRGRLRAVGDLRQVLREPEVAGLLGLPHRPPWRLWGAYRGACGTLLPTLADPAPPSGKSAQLHALLATEAGLG